jgi:hypothetical protein
MHTMTSFIYNSRLPCVVLFTGELHRLTERRCLGDPPVNTIKQRFGEAVKGCGSEIVVETYLFRNVM